MYVGINENKFSVFTPRHPPHTHTLHYSLSRCGLTHKCCTELAKALASEKSIISEVDLSDNNIGDQGLKKLCVGLRSLQCTVEAL